MHPEIIKTKRLILKAVTPTVVNKLASTKTKEELLTYFGFGETGYIQFINMHQNGMQTFSISFYSFLIIEKQSNLPIGEVGFHTWNAKHKRADLFYHIHNETHKQKGFMSEALKKVIEFGFTKLDLHRIAALVADWNTPSVKLIKNNGFSFEGTLREDYVVNGVSENSDCYSLLKHEWRIHQKVKK